MRSLKTAWNGEVVSICIRKLLRNFWGLNFQTNVPCHPTPTAQIHVQCKIRSLGKKHMVILGDHGFRHRFDFSKNSTNSIKTIRLPSRQFLGKLFQLKMNLWENNGFKSEESAPGHATPSIKLSCCWIHQLLIKYWTIWGLTRTSNLKTVPF